GHDMAASLVEPDRLELARDILRRASDRGVQVVLPVDLVVTDDLAAPRRSVGVPAEQVPSGMKAVDIGPESRRRFAAAIAGARTLFWNGPLGVFERPPFDARTPAVAQAVGAPPGPRAGGGGRGRGPRAPFSGWWGGGRRCPRSPGGGGRQDRPRLDR